MPTQIPRRPAIFAADEFSDFDAVAQSEMVRSGRVKPSELLEAALARVHAVNPALNAIASMNPDAARQRASLVQGDEILAGVPTLIKDVLGYPGHPTSYGSRGLGSHVCTTGNPYTNGLDAAGLVVLGKSTTSELGLLGTTETDACGQTRNPWNVSRSTGGSSGGAVAAVASGMVPVAHASDGGGSIRGPASFAGVFGFKPSRGVTYATDMPPDSPLAFILSDHCVSRTVRDSAAWLQATTMNTLLKGVDVKTILSHADSLQIGVYSRDSSGMEPDDDVGEALEKAVELCTKAGHKVCVAAAPAYNVKATASAFHTLTAASIGGLFQTLEKALGPGFNPANFEIYTRSAADRYRALKPTQLLEAAALMVESATAAQNAFDHVDVLLCPTTPFTAPSLGVFSPAQPPELLDSYVEKVASYTAISSIAGWCAMSAPLCYSRKSGMPIGMHFAMPNGADHRLLQLAAQLEQLLS